MSEKKVRIQDDLYEVVNGEWLKTAVIPDDRPTTGGFATLVENVEKIMMRDFKDFAEGKKTSDIPEMRYAISLYKKIMDEKRRNEEGIKPVLQLLEKINSLKSVDDLNNVAAEFMLEGVALPAEMDVTSDMEDATKHSFIILGPSIILPDTTYYADDNEAGKKLIGVYKDMAEKIMKFSPLSAEEQKLYIEDTLKFDALIAKKVKSQLEWSEYYKNNNPMSVDEVAKYVAPFDLKKLLNDLYGDKAPTTIVVYDPKAIKEMNGYFNAENFNLYKHWLYVKTLIKSTACLSMELKTLGTTYRRALTGVVADPVLEKEAYQIASMMYSEPVGVYYGRTYFGEEAKKDVVSLVEKIIETYKLRMKKNTFLAEETKAKAIKKLSTIVIKMGYPDEIREIWSKLVFDENDSFFEAMRKIGAVRTKDELDKLHKPVDRTEWVMPGHMVNACYNPSSNDITFPAAILQKPFYALSQSVSENLGGIGAVIGHEISHAFDNNGANFDENGNLKNWWLEEDFKAFKELTKGMIEQFDGIEFHGGKVSGELTVSENIADNGGMGVTLEIMHTLDNADFKEYFMNWARVWCQKAKEEYIQLLLANDVHSPAVLRANMAPRNFNEWYEAFDVTEKDQMYVAPDKRISIW
ncbi:MAG: M13 family peptidase [Lachnospiraceae bacterium]|nr:M13 family peptidase [Lachnospiraceae bacterium]